jgi:HK97 family phage portal protein
MGFLDRIFSSSKRHVDPLNDERYFTDIIQQQSATGLEVTPDTARRCAAVLACVRVLAETIAHLPFVLYRREGDGRVRETSHPLFALLHDAPNRWQTSFEFREMMMGHVLLRGNAYAQKVMDNRGRVIELVPLNPVKVTPKLTASGDVYYEFRKGQGATILIPADQMFHLKGYASDGLVGVSPIAEARETIGLAMAAEEFGARTFQNDAQPGGVLEHPGKLGDEALENLRGSIQRQHGGVHNARKYMILEEGMKWTRIGMSPDDTQYIETRKFQLEEIARIFRVPPHLIGHLERATFSNIEHQGLEFVTHTILPWLKRWEQAISQRLMTPQERKVYYSEFLVEGLLRGDITVRYQAYAVGRQWGWLSADDVRRLENMDTLPGGQGEKYLLPLNMIDASKLDEYLLTQQEKSETTVVDTDSESDSGDVVEARAAFKDAIERHAERHQGAFVGEKPFQPVFRSTFERLVERLVKSGKPFDQHRNVIKQGVDPIVAGLLLLNERQDADTLALSVVESFLNKWNGESRTADELSDLIIELAKEAVRVN